MRGGEGCLELVHRVHVRFEHAEELRDQWRRAGTEGRQGAEWDAKESICWSIC